MDINGQYASGSGGPAKPRRVALLQVLGVQDWLQLVVLIIAAAVAAGVTTDQYRERPFSLWDATISYPVMASIIPYWVAVVVPLVAGILSFFVGEFWLARRWRGTPFLASLAVFLHFVLDFLSALAACLCVTQALKVSVGRLRPSFLASCQPAMPPPGNLNVTYGLPASANPACTVPTSLSLVDEHYSFPSGHTSTAFVMAVYAAVYCAWAYSWRAPRAQVAAARRRGLGARLAHDLAALAGILWISLLISFAWGVGASRIIDFHHHPSDVAAGALLGTMFGGLFALRGIGRHSLVLEEAGEAEASARTQQAYSEASALREFAAP